MADMALLYFLPILPQSDVGTVTLVLPNGYRMDKNHNNIRIMVPAERIELPTFGLQNRCSTAELCRQNDKIEPWWRGC